MTSRSDAEEYVSENEDTLLRIIKHSPNDFPRALALAALLEFGEQPSIEEVVAELKEYGNGEDWD